MASLSSTPQEVALPHGGLSERHFPCGNNKGVEEKKSNDQTYANAKTFFEDESKGFDEVHRHMGDSTKGNGFESAAAAIKDGLDNMLDKSSATVEERIQIAVEEGIRRMMDQQPPPHSQQMTAPTPPTRK